MTKKIPKQKGMPPVEKSAPLLLNERNISQTDNSVPQIMQSIKFFIHSAIKKVTNKVTIDSEAKVGPGHISITLGGNKFSIDVPTFYIRFTLRLLLIGAPLTYLAIKLIRR